MHPPRRKLASLRATGSRACAPDDRLREAIHRAPQERLLAKEMDCFVALLLAMTMWRGRALPLQRNTSCELPDGQIAHGRHAQIARRAIVPQAGSLARYPKSAPSLPRPAFTRGALRGRHERWKRDAMDADGAYDERA
jgi:hypothetical protein